MVQNVLPTSHFEQSLDHSNSTMRLVRDEPVGFPDPSRARVAVIGLGYVGLPLTLGFARNSRAIGLDISQQKIDELKRGIDFTGEVATADLLTADVDLTTNTAALSEADVIIVCVPTPVDSHNHPDYSPLLAASRTIGENMKRGAVVVFESTVDPGTTEERLPADHRKPLRHEAQPGFSSRLFS